MSNISSARLPQQPQGPPWIELRVKHKVPSLNQLFAMNPWQRRKEKQRTQAAVLSALKAAAEDSLIHERTFTAEQSLLKTHYNTLQSYIMTQRSSPKELSRKRKSEKKKRK